MKKIIGLVAVLTITIALSMPVRSLAQGPGFSDDIVDNGAPCTPLDGGLGLLLLAGVGYGAKKLLDKRKADK